MYTCISVFDESGWRNKILNLSIGFDLESVCNYGRSLTRVCVVAAGAGGGGNDVQWCFSQVKGAIDDDVAEGKFFFLTFSIL